MRVGFEKLLHPASTQYIAPIGNNNGVLKSFGIISLRIDPEPTELTINGLAYQNGEKKIYDYGKYSIIVNRESYLPIDIELELSRQNPFYLNNIRLLKRPESIKISEELTLIETVGNLLITQNATGATRVHQAPFLSGGTFTGTGITIAGTTNTPKYIGEGFFRVNGKLYQLNETGLPIIVATEPGLIMCDDAKMIRSDIYCEKLGKFLTGKYQDLKEKIVEANSEFIRTPSNIIRLGGTFFNSSTPLTQSIVLSGKSHIWNIGDQTLFANNGKMYDFGTGLKETKISDFDKVYSYQKFGDEIIALGTLENESFIRFEDGKNTVRTVSLNQTDLTDATIILRSGAYFIITQQAVFVYFKGASEATPYVYGDIVGFHNGVIYYNVSGETYAIKLDEAP